MNNNNQNIGQLSLAQQFQLEVLRKDIERMSLEQAQEYLFEAFRQIIVKDNLFRDLFKKCSL